MAVELTAAFVKSLLPARPIDGHKGTFGHVLVLAGSRGFTGAAKLTAQGALRSGAGLVTVGIPRSLADIVAASLLEEMTLPLPATEAETLSRAAIEPALSFAVAKHAVVLGPGISQHPETQDFVAALVRRCPIPLLIDADGLNCLSRNTSVLLDSEGPRVVTPHPGEMARLTGLTVQQVQEDREGAAKGFAKVHACVVVLKGHSTIIADPAGASYVNSTGNSGMATGGTGDVLAGLIGGLMAQGVGSFEAALVGVHLHGLAGDIAAERMTGRGMIAGDLMNAIPQAWRALEQKG